MKISNEMIEVLKNTHKFTRYVWEAKTGLSYIGYGHLLKKGEKFTKLTKKECIALFDKDVSYINKTLNTLFKEEIPQNHFDVFASIIYDIGYNMFKTSSLLTLYKKGLLAEASLRIIVWSKYKGIHSDALEYRRKIDYKIFTNNDYTL